MRRITAGKSTTGGEAFGTSESATTARTIAAAFADASNAFDGTHP
jgi:cell pole-organizing protein PopZ